MSVAIQTETPSKGIVDFAKSRHSTKAYDRTKKLTDAQVIKVKELLRYAPSSTNLQPWFFVLASTEEGKERVAKATEKLYPFNTKNILDASHVVVFASRREANEDYLLKVLEVEEADGRYQSDPEALKKQMHAGRSMFVNLHKEQMADVQHWMDKQVYLNIGQFLLGVAALGIDATPMEGIDTEVLDEEFGLHQKGYTSLVAVSLGYHDPERDYNALLPKSRLPYSDILEEV